MTIAGLVFLGIGALGWIGSTFLEWKSRRPHYELLIKLFSISFGVGGILFGLGAI